MTFRLQIFLIVAVLIVFVLLIYLLRKRVLDTKYSLIWLFGTSVVFVLCINPLLIIRLSEFLGVYDPMNALLFIGIAFLICILISLTVIVSRLSERIRTLVQCIAILEKEYKDRFLAESEDKQ